MTLTDWIAIIVGLVTLVSSFISIGVWIGLRRAESKRIVRVEEEIKKVRQEREDYEKKINTRMENYLMGADDRFARKDITELHLTHIRNKQEEIASDVKDIKETIHNRRKDDR